MTQQVIDLDQSPTFGRIKHFARGAWNDFMYGLELYGQAWLNVNQVEMKRRVV